jgi:hypothetical protein
MKRLGPCRNVENAFWVLHQYSDIVPMIGFQVSQRLDNGDKGSFSLAKCTAECLVASFVFCDDKVRSFDGI